MSERAEPEYFPGFERAFFYLDTHGLPLVEQMDACEAKGMRVALDTFVYDALRAGWAFDKAMAVVQEALTEKHGVVKAEEAMKILRYGCVKRIAAGELNEKPQESK